MTILTRMRAEIYASYVENSVKGYASDNVASGRWPEAGAVERSRAEFRELLPQGLATPDNFHFEIKAAASGPTIGFIWFAVVTRHGLRSAFVYGIEVMEEHRRQGHAGRALLALEPLVAALGLSGIGLHVFGHNAGARALYARLGYAVTSINMLKPLGGPA